MDLTSFGSLGRIEKEVVINSELRVKLHTLSALESQKALAELPSSLNSDVAHRSIVLQLSYLIYSTSEVNGTKISLEESKAFYYALQAPVFNEIYSHLDTLIQESQAAVEALKKK